jgi:hypothetical protein
MITVVDFRGRPYEQIEIDRHHTLLECLETGALVRIRNYGWDKIGFCKP